MAVRFGHQYDDEAVKDLIRTSIPKNTLKHDEWAKKMWIEWRASRNEVNESESPPESIYGIKTKEEVDKWVTRFILEVRNASGEEYNPVSLKCLAAAIQRLIRANGYSGPGLMTESSAVCVALNAKLKHLKNSGIGLEVKRADTVNEIDEKKLWDKKIFDMDTSRGLLNLTFFYNGKVLALRGRSEHYNLRIEQFNFKVDPDGTKFVEFWPMTRKNDQGTLTIGPFYHRPIKEKAGPSYSLQIIGINTIGTMLKKMFEDAGINDGRRITNHGLRATSTTTLFEAGFSQRTISLRTGHLSDAINGYIRDSKVTHVAVSKCLEPIKLNENDNGKDDEDEDDAKDGNHDDYEENALVNNVVENNNVDNDGDKGNEEDEEDEDDECDDDDIESGTSCANEQVNSNKSKFLSNPISKVSTKRPTDEQPIIIELERGSKKLKILM